MLEEHRRGNDSKTSKALKEKHSAEPPTVRGGEGSHHCRWDVLAENIPSC